jgi:hypothetical protein
MQGHTFSSFRDYYGKTVKAIEKDASVRLSAKGKALKDEEADAIYEKALSGEMETDITINMPPIEKTIRTMGLTPVQFAYQWRCNEKLMGLGEFKQSHRDSNRMGERMLVMSGQSWKTNSHAQERDWTNMIVAVTLETAFVQSYRHDLLNSSSGIRALRDEMEEFFLSCATSYYHKHPTSGALKSQLKWSFPDGIKPDVGPSKVKLYDPDQQRKDLLTANPAAGIAQKQKRNAMIFTVETLEKNPLLFCSDPQVTAGTVETLAHHCINTLARVPSPFVPHVSLARSHRLDVYRSYTSTAHASRSKTLTRKKTLTERMSSRPTTNPNHTQSRRNSPNR